MGISSGDKIISFIKRSGWEILFFAVLLGSIGVKIYKADYAGMTYDENMTLRHFCGSLDRALNTFTDVNNHVLNSVLICFAKKYFGSYEHFIRIPSLLAGILYSISVAVIVRHTIKQRVLRVAALAMVSFTPFVFNYSFLARGYAFGLAGIFGAIAVVVWLMDHKIRWRYWIVPVLLISVMNFIAFGGMLSSVLILTAFNLTFVLYCQGLFGTSSIEAKSDDNSDTIPKKVKAMFVCGISVFILSIVFLYFLYRGVYKDIPNNSVLQKVASTWNGWPTFVKYMDRLLVGKIFDLRPDGGVWAFWAIIVFVVIAMIFHCVRFRKAVIGKYWRDWFDAGPTAFVIIMTLLSLVIIFIYCVILDRHPGLLRSQIFIIPLVELCGLIIIDRFGADIRSVKIGQAVRFVGVVVVVAVILSNTVSPRHMGSMTISKPLLRKLRAIDPDKTWVIGISKKVRSDRMGFLYYEQWDYKFKFAEEKDFDLYLCHRSERVEGALCLEWDYFSKVNRTVMVNSKLPDDKVVISARLIRKDDD